MGKTLIKQGDIYNYFTVIGDKPIRVGTRSKWLCRCVCGVEKYVDSSSLRSGNSKSCGCYARQIASLHNQKNLVGQKFGKLTVLKDSGQRYAWNNGSNILWECQCECGNKILVKTNALTQGSKTHCGCSVLKGKQFNGNYKDLTNQRFGHLVVMYDTNIRKSNHVYWHCKCDCGQEKDISSTRLLSGETVSCGCLKISKGEDKILALLKEMSINFVFQKTFNDCRNPKTNTILFFDFYLPDYNCIIEYDGEQHFHPTGQRFTANLVKDIQFRDNIKNQYCLQNKIKIIRIPYTDFKILNKDYLIQSLNKGEL